MKQKKAKGEKIRNSRRKGRGKLGKNPIEINRQEDSQNCLLDNEGL